MLLSMFMSRKRPRFRLYPVIECPNLFYLKVKFLWWWIPVRYKGKDRKGFKWYAIDADTYVAYIYGAYDPATKRKKSLAPVKEYI